MHIKVLDCTLRDGGYVNNWNFGSKNIGKILAGLINANVDYIECGFISDKPYDKEKTLFNDCASLDKFLPECLGNSHLVGMINSGDVNIPNLPDNDRNFLVRIAFKKAQVDQAIQEAAQLMAKGYEVFLNPMNTITYTDAELLGLIEKINELHPAGMAIVDTTGTMTNVDVARIFYLVDHNLYEGIMLGFHSHNNLQLSFSNAQELIRLNSKRVLVIDTTVFGMGRGAGNLPTELLVRYLNDSCDKKYDLIPILTIIDEQIGKIFAKTPWGYSVPYYLAAANNCHPNYASYLVEKHSVTVEFINSILQNIPVEKRTVYDKNLIEQMYIDYQNYFIDDSQLVQGLKKDLCGKQILVLAPGKTILSNKNIVTEFIEMQKPIVVSLNFAADSYPVDMTFVTNTKRFNSLDELDSRLLVTSNIQNTSSGVEVLNYSSYLNSSKLPDNAALMFLRLSRMIGVKKITFAGLDGFTNINLDNYFNGDLVHKAKDDEFALKNEAMINEIHEMKKDMEIVFLTPSIYDVKF